MAHNVRCLHGSVINAWGPEDVECLQHTLIIIGISGYIEQFMPNVGREEVPSILMKFGYSTDLEIRYLTRTEFLIPGFVDAHNHAPQYAQRGLGQGLHILDWLNQLTFPNEAKFKDIEYARRVYSRCVDGFLKQGITCASYYGSLHGPATKILAEICLHKGQRALVGKCNMNQNSPEYYIEQSAAQSLKDTEDFISHVGALDRSYDLVMPILTPRFAISCTSDLLTGLGKLAQTHSLPVQTHFNEAQQEIDATLQLFPFDNEADLYDHFGLLTSRTILAHCTIMKSDHEFARLKERDCGVAHCPIANTTVGGGFMAAPIREFLRRGIKVGLGTDSGGGFSSSILDAIRQALIVSNAHEVSTQGRDRALTLKELFYLATLGGAQVCGLQDKIGNFEVGKEFDAILVQGVSVDSDPDQDRDVGVMTMIEEQDSLETIFEKFLVSGDDRNIAEVYVRNRRVK